MNIVTRLTRLERLASPAEAEQITRIVLVPFRREGEPAPSEEEGIVFWERKEQAGGRR